MKAIKKYYKLTTDRRLLSKSNLPGNDFKDLAGKKVFATTRRGNTLIVFEVKEGNRLGQRWECWEDCLLPVDVTDWKERLSK